MESGAIVGIVPDDRVAHALARLMLPLAPPKGTTKTTCPGFGPTKAEMPGHILQPVRKSRKMNVPVNQSEHICRTFAEPLHE
jgi:hypothetical protein